MGVNDGYVVGTTKVVDHGPDNVRWNLVIIGDGYQAAELQQYHTDVQNFLTTFRTTPPFDELFCGINVHRVDVVSTDSGADDSGCAGGIATTADTYFDAKYCTEFAGTPMDRLLTVDSTLALNVATAQVPLRHQVLCIVNHNKYGGAGGAIATCSTHASAAEIAIHEMGHSAFGLADEYGGNGAGTPAGEPAQPNVTRDTNRATNKWRDLIDPATPMPSQCDGTCAASTCVAPATPPAAGAVGTYEGAIHSNCNTYRPVPSCYMRNYSPFCPVCSRVIRNTLQPFLPAETINLITPSINFTNVPAGMGGIGVTTHRAIVWEVVTCRQLTFQITAGPTGGFGTPQGFSVTVTTDPILPVTYARIWISYTSTDPGDSANGNVTVQCDETGQTWNVNIVANTIARPQAAVALVLDRSGSMDEDAGDAFTKVQKLREAADVFINVMLPGDGIGLVRFNQSAQRIMEIQDVGAVPGGAGRVAAMGHIQGNDLDPSGSTSIGDGVINGKQMLDDAQVAAATPYDVTAMVVLTDGMWNQPPSLADVAGSITANTYAVGLGLPSNISVPALTTLCQGNNGYLLITGLLSNDQSMLLSKYFLQILAGVTNAQVAADPGGVLDKTAEHRIPFHITEADYGMDLIILSQAPYVIDFQLETPDGNRIKPEAEASGANLKFVKSRYAAYYRCALPVLPAAADGSHDGMWHAILKLGDLSSFKPVYDKRHKHYGAHFNPKLGILPYEFVAHTYSSLTLSVSVNQSGFDVGAIAYITASLLEYNVPLKGSAKVWGEVRLPDGSTEYLSFDLHQEDRFLAVYELFLQGVYSIRIRAQGETMKGSRFEREKTLTVQAVPGGDLWSPDGPKPNQLCELLHCLKGSGVFDGEMVERAKEMGIDLPTLYKCLAENCYSVADKLEARKRKK